ncbi:MAG: hypothetical protein KatS3mg078_1189 [Deltaproteobacteria bacterium]|jgi:hypothetical protein|nr:MAG: hypothetical protein KatS3mg078_1189 [Deltaproteobacteria bacterium]
MGIPLVVWILLPLLIITPKLEAKEKPQYQGQVITHTVKKGEELHLLASYYLLDARKWHMIYLWNSSTIKDKNRIYPGQKLIIYTDKDWNPPYDLDEFLRGIGRR